MDLSGNMVNGFEAMTTVVASCYQNFLGKQQVERCDVDVGIL